MTTTAQIKRSSLRCARRCTCALRSASATVLSALRLCASMRACSAHARTHAHTHTHARTHARTHSRRAPLTSAWKAQGTAGVWVPPPTQRRTNQRYRREKRPPCQVKDTHTRNARVPAPVSRVCGGYSCYPAPPPPPLAPPRLTAPAPGGCIVLCRPPTSPSSCCAFSSATAADKTRTRKQCLHPNRGLV